VLSGEEETEFWLLYRKTSEALLRKAYRMCRGHLADAKDVHQQTYLKALEHWSTVQGLTDGQRFAWLATTLAREALQIYRSPHRLKEIGPDNGFERAADGTADLADTVLTKGLYRRVCSAIAELSERQRDVIALHCLVGYGISDVASMLGITSATVRVHLHFGRARLREIMAEVGSA
jgi:RNA polymerase sigma factor (sigma-70 family)